MSGPIYVGATVSIVLDAVDEQRGGPFDPAARNQTLAITVQRADDTEAYAVYTYGTDNEIVRDSAGCYRANITFPTEGRWLFAWATKADDGGRTVLTGATCGELDVVALSPPLEDA